MSIDPLARGITPAAAHIADGKHLHIGPAEETAGNVGPRAPEQVAAALPPHADESHRDAFAGRHGAAATKRGGGHKRRERHGAGRGRSAAQELAAGKPAG